MNYYEHHMGDWARKCSHLNCLEEGVYRRALDWYYTNEKQLPLGLDELARVLRLQGELERETLIRVLNEFFDRMPTGWSHSRVEREIRRFKAKQPLIADHKEGLRIRNERARQRRRAMFEQLRAHGFIAPWNASAKILLEMLAERGLTFTDTASDTACDTVSDTGSGCARDTATHTPNTGLSGVPLDLHTNPNVDLEARANAVRAIRTAGFPDASPGDPRLIALVQDGATPEELALIAAEASAKGKGWAWLLATAKGRREDAKQAQEGPKSARQRADAAKLGEWLPNLSKTRPEGEVFDADA